MAHKTLRPGYNVAMILIWGVLALVITMMSSPPPLEIVAVGSVFGLILGIMQTKGLSEVGNSICEAKTAIEVRSRLKETNWGRKYIYTLWASTAVLATLWFFTSKQPLSLLAGYVTLMFVRELLTLRVTFQLNRK